ncbi:MAG: 50S ribosomal protein L6 [Acidimicrobiaceae bacterium]|nr:50S ribosomal protein L6 [Acidimicrobiaceae bacterium]MXZ66813.1 50S ribosomal protein L6 [Acidimicrobiaceae bacterium]MYF32917.1 50S ribosomal protein L6 [Acidimicrobiaceae bacterium]MYG78558.1 50S ribosomal protein L6 [Acidimicrobiaceae bacterium]MYJ29701.1 50S ribosomal protein L6 [Acidimicrobiaceae bacterium]
MSRVGSAPITIPSGVDVAVEGRTVVVTGTKGTLSRELPGEITVRPADGALLVERPDDTARSKSLHGLTRSLVQNMVTGVSEGFTKELRIQGVGYRVAESTPASLELALGFSHTVKITAPTGVEFEVPQRTQILVKGIDKQLVGQVAADIRKWRPPEPYKGKGIRYIDERVKRKAGKAAK